MPNGYIVLERKVERERGSLCYFLRKKGCKKAAPEHQIMESYRIESGLLIGIHFFRWNMKVRMFSKPCGLRHTADHGKFFFGK